VLHSPLLTGLHWLDHGFGTRADLIPQETMASLKQIHSGIVLLGEQIGCAGEGDALVTNHPGVPVSVRTADCYAILLADERNRAVAAVHAGWRGTTAHIVIRALEEMHRLYGTDRTDVHAAIGPGIGGCCYEVGADVARQFGLEQAGRIDLAAINRRQLLDAGIAEYRIDVLGGCTKCDAQLFHSYRRDRLAAGRMVSYIARTEASA
jgi:purine-nucleoside/S-methyl-5'-thioadenosine phosphorylase / adenosine deaminase